MSRLELRVVKIMCSFFKYYGLNGKLHVPFQRVAAAPHTSPAVNPKPHHSLTYHTPPPEKRTFWDQKIKLLDGEDQYRSCATAGWKVPGPQSCIKICHTPFRKEKRAATWMSMLTVWNSRLWSWFACCAPESLELETYTCRIYSELCTFSV